MEFCEQCDNMLYIALDDDDKTLLYHCKACGSKTPAPPDKLHVLDNNYVDDNTNYSLYVNPNIIHDPTLPRVNNIPCPNPSCTKPKTESNSVIYVKYDEPNMKYMYHCTHCSYFWKLK